MAIESSAKTTFYTNLDEPMRLLELTTLEVDEKTRSALLKSAVVVSVSYLERYIEDLLVEGCTFIAEGLRNPLDLPVNTKQEIALRMISEKREVNPNEFSVSIWSFAGDGWADQYKKYTNQVVKSFNTANSTNIKDVIWDIFGIRDAFKNWTSPDPEEVMDIDTLDGFINRRHEIAHGSFDVSKGVDSKIIFPPLRLILSLVKHIDAVVWNQIATIVQKSGLTWGLKSRYLFEIINYFKENGFEPVTNETFQKISTTANSNYNKLSYAPWNLLEIKSPKRIIPTNDMAEFIAGKLALPAQINVLKNQKALPKPNTHFLYYQDLVDYFSKPSVVS